MYIICTSSFKIKGNICQECDLKIYKTFIWVSECERERERECVELIQKVKMDNGTPQNLILAYPSQKQNPPVHNGRPLYLKCTACKR